ncbi:hypothetical protein BKA67DRAFT_556969 [Truncatella angustata]|uniref:Uncharacterized protein n=1 Tax=Truncatella angustata TaxID=152316 RepID=A0A9P8UTE8_9PEZI|nr:uncharacterized protein BKA67DRAFT_556969 [Truncatella angustata]KAH6658019.1 hypothetical protein BKA67DRAFT_556969 [Truncatella angustata]
MPSRQQPSLFRPFLLLPSYFLISLSGITTRWPPDNRLCALSLHIPLQLFIFLEALRPVLIYKDG